MATVVNAYRGNEAALLEQIAAGDDIEGLIRGMEKKGT